MYIQCFQNIISEQVFLPRILKGLIFLKKEYINEINNLLPLADTELLDFIFQLLNKSVEKKLPLQNYINKLFNACKLFRV